MNTKLDKQLVTKYPNLYKHRHLSMRETAMCWGFCCGDGWFKLIDDLSEKLETLIIQAKLDDSEGWKNGYYRAAQVKEKFGTLRFYMTGTTEDMNKLIGQAELNSEKICEVCGKPGKLNSIGWLKTLCKKHRKERE